MKELPEEVERILHQVPRWRKWGFTPEEQKDASQHLYLEVQKAMEGFREESSLKSFVYRVCSRRCIDLLRKKIRKDGPLVPVMMEEQDGVWVEREFADDTYDPIREVERSEKSLLVRECVAQLTDTCQEALQDFYKEDLSYEAIAEKRGIAVNTVGSRLHKCIGKLKDLLKKLPALREYLELRHDPTQ